MLDGNYKIVESINVFRDSVGFLQLKAGTIVTVRGKYSNTTSQRFPTEMIEICKHKLVRVR